VRAVEAKYNVFIEYVNMTWEGIRENIPVSMMSGIPGAEIYLVEAPTSVPAVLRGWAVGLESLDIDPSRFPDEHNVVMDSVMIPGQDETYLFKPSVIHPGIYMIGYNREMLEARGLEDPQKLWDEDRWTWDVFREYVRLLTDPSRDIYGWSGYWTNFLQGLLFSNNAAFAPGPVQTLDHPNTMEVLTFMSNLYNVDRSARPWDTSNWYINNNIYAEGKSAFWISTTWLNNEQGGGSATGNPPLPFDFGMVPFPVGPNGDKYTNPAVSVEGGYFFIPRFIRDSTQVYDIIYDFTNWFDYDLNYRNDLSWISDSLGSEENLRLYLELAERPVGFDLIFNLGLPSAATDMILETTEGPAVYTPAQYVESFRQVFQDALNNYFG
jgi:ABC-type glycerol-3-phosphate transport system substrate-binding protein